MNRKKFPVTNIGTALLLTVFIILALVTFATLSLVGANRDYQSGKKVAGRTAAYYEASNEAQTVLAQIDAVLLQSYDASASVYYKKAAEGLQAVSGIEADLSAASPSLRYRIPVSDTHTLLVELLISHPQKEADGFYEIKTWQEVSVKEWSSDTKLPLLR